MNLNSLKNTSGMKTTGAGTMKAAVFTGPHKFEIRHVEKPEPGFGEVRVQLEGSGVCASNLAAWEGMPWTHYPSEPGALGHEGWGILDSIGEGVHDLKVGDRVALLSHHAYAEYDIAKADCVLRLPERLKDLPFPGEALACTMNILARSDINSHSTVAVIGIGFLGAMITSLAKSAGARVIAISRRPFACEIAHCMGADEVISLTSKEDVVKKVADLTDGKFCDRVVEATGQQLPLDLAGEITREHGKLIIAGYHQDGPRQVNMQLWNWRGIDVINAHERDPSVYMEGMKKALKNFQIGLFDPTTLITHSYPLDHIDEALNATQTRPDGFLKAVVRL
jgi:threonine dehydrogenase-like Zn-dependent dehydrogenase